MVLRTRLDRTRRLGTAIAATLTLACGDGSRQEPLPTGVTPASEPAGQLVIMQASFISDSAWAGSTDATTPTVRVIRVVPGQGIQSIDNPGVYGLTVHCAVTSGGGTVQEATVVTDVFGLATCGAWSLGPDAGPNVVTVSVDGASPITMTTEARVRPNNLGSYNLVAWSGFPSNGTGALTGGELELGDDGSLEVGQHYAHWNVANPGGAPAPPSSWILLSYARSGTSISLADPLTTGELRGDTLVFTTTLSDDYGSAIGQQRQVYVRSAAPLPDRHSVISRPAPRPPEQFRSRRANAQ